MVRFSTSKGHLLIRWGVNLDLHVPLWYKRQLQLPCKEHDVGSNPTKGFAGGKTNGALGGCNPPEVGSIPTSPSGYYG